MKKILIAVPFSLQTIHARVKIEKEILEEEGFSVSLFSGFDSVIPNLIIKIFNLLTLKYFDWGYIFSIVKISKKYDIVLIYNFKLLPLVLFVKNKKIIYQTLDHNVSYHFYELSKRLPPLSYFKKILLPTFTYLEKNIAKKASNIIVNSYPLGDYLANSIVNLYSSPFEGISLSHNSHKKFALLYVGKLSVEKGSLETVQLANRMNIPLYIFGRIGDLKTKEILQDKMCNFIGNFPPEKLLIELKKLSENFNFLGVSLIKKSHFSYSIQEANKDIDYLALGVPIIGNERLPTKEKIDAGCGFFINDVNDINDIKDYDKLSNNCVEYYNRFYTKEIFKKNLLKAI